MKEVTDDEFLKFVIHHHKDIKELNKIYEAAKADLPQCAGREVAKAILDMGNGFFKKQGLEVTDHSEGPWWCDPQLYDKKTATGPYFQFEIVRFKWEWLASNDPGDAKLIFYVDTDGIKGRSAKNSYLDKWYKSLKANKDRLRERGIYLEEKLNYRAPYLASRPLHEVNINLMADQNLFRKRVQQAVAEFTSALLPVLRRKK